MRLKFISLLFLISLSGTITAQTIPDWNWTRDIQCSGSTSPSNGFSIALDDSGNVFTAGYFQSTVTVGTTVHTATAGNDALLVKYDPQGNVLWSVSGHGTGMENATGVAIDQSGNIYLTGIFTSNLNFGGLTATNPSTGFGQILIAKYDRQ